MNRLITKVTGPNGTARVYRDREFSVEAGQWSVLHAPLATDANGRTFEWRALESSWFGHSREEAMVEAYRVSGAEPPVPGLGCISWGPAIGEYALAKSKEAA